MITIFLKNNILTLKSDNADLVWSDIFTLENIDQNSIYLSSLKNTSSYWSGEKSVISNVGQYSQRGFEIDSVMNGPNRLFYKIKCDSVSIALLDGSDNNSQIIDKIGEPDVLVIKVSDQKPEDILSLSQNTNSKLVVLLSKEGVNEKFKQILTQNLTLIENGYKIRSKDLNNENTQYLILNQ